MCSKEKKLTIYFDKFIQQTLSHLSLGSLLVSKDKAPDFILPVKTDAPKVSEGLLQYYT